jgi:hypothetical protein
MGSAFYSEFGCEWQKCESSIAGRGWHHQRVMKHPLLTTLFAALLILLAAFAQPLWRMAAGPPAQALIESDMPWQVPVAADGHSRAFGLALPGATLADARQRWGDDLQVAVMAQRGQPGALEAYLENFRAGAITGRLVLAADPGADVVARLRANAVHDEPVDADARRYTLRADDMAEALRAPLVGITFIPAAQLDADTLRGRFGAPAERLVDAAPAGGKPIEQWLYPALGLAVALDPQGRELLQYVAPADFERRLRAPLLAAGANPAP